MKAGDLVYIPSEVVLSQFNEIDDIDLEKIYIGPSPMKILRLERPANLLLTEIKLLDKKYVKVWYNGEEWHVDKHDVNMLREER